MSCFPAVLHKSQSYKTLHVCAYLELSTFLSHTCFVVCKRSTNDKKEVVCLLPSAATACCSPSCSPGAAVSEPTIRGRWVESLSARHLARRERRHIVRSVEATLRPDIRPARAGWRCSCTDRVGCGETSFSSPHLLLRRHHFFFFQLLLVLRWKHRLHQRRLTGCKAAPATPNRDLHLS